MSLLKGLKLGRAMRREATAAIEEAERDAVKEVLGISEDTTDTDENDWLNKYNRGLKSDCQQMMNDIYEYIKGESDTTVMISNIPNETNMYAVYIEDTQGAAINFSQALNGLYQKCNSLMYENALNYSHLIEAVYTAMYTSLNILIECINVGIVGKTTLVDIKDALGYTLDYLNTDEDETRIVDGADILAGYSMLGDIAVIISTELEDIVNFKEFNKPKTYQVVRDICKLQVAISTGTTILSNCNLVTEHVSSEEAVDVWNLIKGCDKPIVEIDTIGDSCCHGHSGDCDDSNGDHDCDCGCNDEYIPTDVLSAIGAMAMSAKNIVSEIERIADNLITEE